ncbi:hypothetical protein E2320_008191 [Naja naja]|nr:hypothetical protein E2320_008191 [Naja naja]
MLPILLLLCGAVGLLKSEPHSRHPGYHPQRPGPEVPEMPAPPPPSSPAEDFWRRESIQGETEADLEESYPASRESRNNLIRIPKQGDMKTMISIILDQCSQKKAFKLYLGNLKFISCLEFEAAHSEKGMQEERQIHQMAAMCNRVKKD